jgi:hypothetical protein
LQHIARARRLARVAVLLAVSLWHFNTGQDIRASPKSYAVNGNQYVAIAAGGDVLSFSLH